MYEVLSYPYRTLSKQNSAFREKIDTGFSKLLFTCPEQHFRKTLLLWKKFFLSNLGICRKVSGLWQKVLSSVFQTALCVSTTTFSDFLASFRFSGTFDFWIIFSLNFSQNFVNAAFLLFCETFWCETHRNKRFNLLKFWATIFHKFCQTISRRSL